VAGRAVADDAVMIDLAEMKGAVVDVEARTVRAEGGLTWGELNSATTEHALGVTGGVISTTGIAGLTLGGGLGWLMAKHGLAADNLLAVELVNAAGDVLEVTEASDPDLFWACVAVAATSESRPPSPTACIRWAWSRAVCRPSGRRGARHAPLLPRRRRERLRRPDGVRRARARSRRSGVKLSAMAVFHTGDPEQAEKDLAPFEELGLAAHGRGGPMPYAVMNTILDAGYPTGSLNYWLSSFTRGLPDELIDGMASASRPCLHR
jgi:hypothetical protein